MLAFIALGSNLDDSLAHVRHAIEEISQHPAISTVKHSAWYTSKAVGPGDQPDYINGVARFETTLTAIELLDYLQSIEHKHGRERSVRWGARTLDLDILLFGNQTIESERLSVPHPRMYERAFVMTPLNDIASGLLLPNNHTVCHIAAQLDQCGLALHATN